MTALEIFTVFVTITTIGIPLWATRGQEGNLVQRWIRYHKQNPLVVKKTEPQAPDHPPLTAPVKFRLTPDGHNNGDLITVNLADGTTRTYEVGRWYEMSAEESEKFHEAILAENLHTRAHPNGGTVDLTTEETRRLLARTYPGNTHP